MSFVSVMQEEVNSISQMFSIHRDKAFPVWFAQIVLDLDVDDAYDALNVEGPNEKSMDLFWIDHSNKRIFIAQCKYSPAGTSHPGVKEVTGLFSVSNWLSSPTALEREGRPELVEVAKAYQEARTQGYSTQLWFVYCGKKDENIDKEIRVYNQNPENEQYGRLAINCDISIIENLFNESRGEGRRIESAKIKISKAFEVSGNFGKGIVTSIEASDLIQLYNEFGDYLFARNVRGWLGRRKGTVNASIIETVENKKEKGNFWAYNNGITIVCDEYTPPKSLSRGGKIKLSNFSIVNGCQTTVALAQAESSVTENVFVLARIICPPNSIIDSVIKYTNSQNLIRQWDFASQDPTQDRLKKEFENLEMPIYYGIKRGDWSSLSNEEKKKFKTDDGKGSVRTIPHDLLAQYIASFKGRAVVAYKNKAFIFTQYYDQTFPADIRMEEALFIWRVGEITQELVREEIRKETEKVENGELNRDKYILMLKRGGRFYSVGVLGLLAKLRNGPDYLRSITEERIVSKAAAERIEKYGRLAIQWYKQAVDDLLQLSKTDLSVLIREADFFDKVSERITNTYSAMEINKDWLDGVLPKLR